MKKILIVIITVGLLVGYFLPVTVIRVPIDKTIAFAIGRMHEWGWLFSDKDCGKYTEEIAMREHDYCGTNLNENDSETPNN